MSSYLLTPIMFLGVLSVAAENLAPLEKELSEKYDAGRFAEAIPIAEEIVAIRRAQGGESEIEYGESLTRLGALYAKMCQYGQAESTLRQAVDIDHDTQRGRTLHADSLYELGYLYLLTGDYEKSQDYLDQAKVLRGESVGETHPDFAKSLYGLAELSAALGDQEIALSLHERALEIRRSTLGERHPNYAKSLHRLGATYAELGRMDEARPLFEAALAIRRDVLDKSHPDIADSLATAGLLFCITGRLAEAEPLLQEALKIYKAIFGENHLAVADAMNNLGYLYWRIGKFDLAEPLFQKALEITRKKLGDAHPDYANGLNNLAAVYLQIGEMEKIEPLLEQALDIKRRTLPKEHPDIIMGLENLGVFCLKMKNYESAESYLEKAIKMGRKAFGPTHPSYASCVGVLGALYLETKDYAKAEVPLREAIDILRLAPGENNPELAGHLANLGLVYEKQGNYTEAEPLLREALDIRSRIFEEHHPDRVDVMDLLASLLKETGQYEEAEQLYRQVVQIRGKALGKEHPDYAKSLTDLAELYMKNGAHDRALPLVEEAVEAWSKSGQEQRSALAVGRAHLGVIYFALGQLEKAKPLLEEAAQMARPGSDEERLLYVHVRGLSILAILRFSEEGATEKAVLLLDEAVRIGREEPVAGGAVLVKNLAALGGLYWDTGDQKKSEALLQEASGLLRDVPGEERLEYLSGLSTLFGHYRRSGQHAIVVTVIDALLKDNPECATLFVKRGKAHMDLAEYRNASDDFEQALKLNPDDPEALHQRGHLHQGLGEWDRARSDYSYAIEHGGPPSHLYGARGTVHMLQGDTDAAIADYEKAMETRGSGQGIDSADETIGILNNLTLLYSSKGDHDAVVPFSIELVKLLKATRGDEHPDYLTELYNLGATYLATGDYEKAKACLESAAKTRARVLGENHPDHAKTTACIAILHLMMDAQAGHPPVSVEYEGSMEAEMIELLKSERFADAMVAAGWILELRREKYEEDSVLYAASLIKMAKFHLSQSDFHRAQPLLERALRIQKTLLGEGHSEFFATQQILDAVQRRNMPIPSLDASSPVHQQESSAKVDRTLLRRIFLSFDPGNPETRDRAKAHMKEIWDALEAGGDFQELAKAHSEGPCAEEGGLVGWVTKGDLVEALESVVFGLEVGKYSQVVETEEYGLQILYVEDRQRAGAASSDEVQVEAIETIREQKTPENAEPRTAPPTKIPADLEDDASKELSALSGQPDALPTVEGLLALASRNSLSEADITSFELKGFTESGELRVRFAAAGQVPIPADTDSTEYENLLPASGFADALEVAHE